MNRANGAPRADGVQHPTPVRRIVGPVLKRQRRSLGLIALSSVTGGFAEAAVLLIIAHVAVSIAQQDAGGSAVHLSLGSAHLTVHISQLLVVAGSLVLIRVLLSAWLARLSAATTTAVVTDLRKNLVGSYLAASWDLQSDERQGRLQELLTTYTTEASAALLSLTGGLVASLNLLALIVTALVVNPPASLAVAATAVGVGLLLRPLRGSVRRRSELMANANLDFATGLTELAATTQEVRIFEVGPQVREQLDEFVEEVAKRQCARIFLVHLLPAVYQAAALGLIVAALALAYDIGFSQLSALGAVVLIMLRSVSYGQTLQAGMQSLHDSAPYFETLLKETARYDGAALDRSGTHISSIGALAFEDVAFEYEPGRRVLSDLNFSVATGEIIGIVGPSGAGKSTLVQLILRLRAPTAGVILVDGQDVCEVSIDDWYHHVTFVPQEPLLFAGTIAENIRFFREGISDERVQSAARRANLHDDVVVTAQGYESQVGERGGHLSGGERQRLCIARALVDDPDIIVFDEPTSSLDARSEALMRDAMRELAPRTTIFVIAHRLSTLTMCDRIMVIHGGTIQGFDEPKRLAQTDRFYREVLELSRMS
jgi:ATP-binding cassette subfamily B protein